MGAYIREFSNDYISSNGYICNDYICNDYISKKLSPKVDIYSHITNYSCLRFWHIFN